MRTMMVLALLVAGAGATAQVPTSGAAADALAPFDGEWRGPATLTMPGGTTRTLIQTERVGPALGGDVRLIEGHSYNPDGSEGGFNALAVISAGADGAYEFRSYAKGRAGTFPLKVTPGGFEWAMPAGPDAVVRYTAAVTGGRWHEEGWYERGGKRLARVFDMTLNRVGDSAWPAGRAVAPK
ncbi:hypothetical protein [Sphingomonas jatrophae]|uniref:DUF1579 domain-containing protein n=1 Tax=Sphingomonas jatrophae TaxID=1166337 RepID=A0A1I6KY49_9SPHN|nr:hypothetical protein [Sphingomonas jatrophae]SFR96107.1 hypothetical protein SAMN05192580_1924 [Sphingomonas jatrophae]